ncbi:ubiquitin/ribosomal protein S27a, putative [Leishmania tarentolae]|uniref:Ubiquitin/ribosomal protein S27a, putative n=1 Tax=Leishmania tarentolae TaxID=5689 RepID=A0A640L002_LEITA|nr:ubiquitin/ribosomal protein S27a, putative [Leishmania tarentolae]
MYCAAALLALCLVGEVALAAVLTVLVLGHVHTGAALGVRAVLARALHLVRAVVVLRHLEVLERAHLLQLVAVRRLLRLREDALLLLLTLTALHRDDNVNSGLLRQAGSGERLLLREALACKEEVALRHVGLSLEEGDSVLGGHTHRHRAAGSVLHKDLHAFLFSLLCMKRCGGRRMGEGDCHGVHATIVHIKTCIGKREREKQRKK